MKNIYKYLFSLYILSIGVIILLMIRGGIDNVLGNKMLITIFVLSFITRGITAIEQHTPEKKDKY